MVIVLYRKAEGRKARGARRGLPKKSRSLLLFARREIICSLVDLENEPLMFLSVKKTQQFPLCSSEASGVQRIVSLKNLGSNKTSDTFVPNFPRVLHKVLKRRDREEKGEWYALW